jgi:toxin-antitoxin system PIN domain toxin
VYAHREDVDRHDEYRAWLERTVGAEQPYGLAELVLSGFLRIVTHTKVFTKPTPLPQALAFCEALRRRPNATVLSPGPRHWQIFTGLCAESGARGNLVADAYLAAIAIETGSEWITTDGDYRRFRGLRLRHPLEV